MTVQLATNTDLDQIEIWLKEEKVLHGEGFSDNFSSLEAHFKEKSLYSLLNSQKMPIAFITGPIHYPSILCVKYDYRGQGYGTKLGSIHYTTSQRQ